MKSASVTIKNPTGLHARPASDFCKLANSLGCDIKLEKEGKAINGKSVIAIMSLGVGQGSTLQIRTEGEGEEEALNSLVSYFDTLED